MFYATQLFNVLGQGAKSSLLNTAIVGAVNVGSTIVAIVLVDRSVCTLMSCKSVMQVGYTLRLALD